MKGVLAPLLICAFALVLASAAYADWPHEVKWDQLEPYAHTMFDVQPSYMSEQGVKVVADDFLCGETGTITDIEFFGSCPNIAALMQFRITFWSDVPATADAASHPGQLLNEIYVAKACPCDPLGIGWKVIEEGVDASRFKINLPIEDWFNQNKGTVYWIGIQGVLPDVSIFNWCCRDYTASNWGDDAAWGAALEPSTWGHLVWANTDFGLGALDEASAIGLGYEPLKSADMSFRLTGTAIPEPGLLAVLTVAGVALFKRRAR